MIHVRRFFRRLLQNPSNSACPDVHSHLLYFWLLVNIPFFLRTSFVGSDLRIGISTGSPTTPSYTDGLFLFANMLNLPLSLLSDDLLVSIIEQLATLPFGDWSLKILSLADRAFTQSCQNYIFFSKARIRQWDEYIQAANKGEKVLDDKPSFADRVRILELRAGISSEESASLFKDPNFTSILQLLAKSPIPPHELHFAGRGLMPVVPSIMEDTSLYDFCQLASQSE